MSISTYTLSAGSEARKLEGFPMKNPGFDAGTCLTHKFY